MREVTLSLAILSMLSCGPKEPEGPSAGEACDEEGQCAPGLDCVHLICADDRGPQVTLAFPEHLQAFDVGPTELLLAAMALDAAEGDQIELALDSELGGPAPEIVDAQADPATVMLTLAAPLGVGPHHVRARILDADGQAYANPSARDEVVIFVRDPDYPDTPQVTLVWPPAGYEHRVGTPLEIEVAVLPGSFALVPNAESCLPLPDCEPIFDPTCEDDCGPVTREGHPKIYFRDDFPGCLLDEPLDCTGFYELSMRPTSDLIEVIPETSLRSAVPGDRIETTGPLDVHVMLSYAYHAAYPTDAAVIYETIPIKLIE